MIRFICLCAVLAVIFTNPVMAAEACDEHTVNVKVNGLVCDFCARALEKVFSKREEMEGIHVDLDNGLVQIMQKSGQSMDDATLKQLITDSGYNVTSIKRGC